MNINREPKFSILLPTHNRLDLLSYAVDSVLNQPFADFEIIISDNQSEEDIEGYVGSLSDDRIRYFRTDTFLPVTDNWNRAWNESLGQYCIMLGDDDGLTQNALTDLCKVIDEFDEPEFIYTNAIQFGYPGVIPNQHKGFVQRPYLPLMENRSEPYVLDKKAAQSIVEDSCQFYLPLVYNMQHSVVKRSYAKQLKVKGDFFHSPYPDYYATNMLFLMAPNIVVNPRVTSVVGISPKSFGYFYFNDLEELGNQMLNNAVTDGTAKRFGDKILPGSAMNTSWMSAVDMVLQHYGRKLGNELNISRYRKIQIYSAFEKFGLEGVKQFWHQLNLKEKITVKIVNYFYLIAQKEGIGNEFLARLQRSWFPYPYYDSQKSEVDHLILTDVVKDSQGIEEYTSTFKDYKPGASRLSLLSFLRSYIGEKVSQFFEGLFQKFELNSPQDWQTLTSPIVRFKWKLGSPSSLLCEAVLADYKTRHELEITSDHGWFSYKASPKETLPNGKYFLEFSLKPSKTCFHKSGFLLNQPYDLEKAIQILDWKPQFESQVSERQEQFDFASAQVTNDKPRFSITTTVYDTPLPYFKELVGCLADQSFADFEWVILDNGSSNPELVAYLRDLSKSMKQVRLHRVESNIHIIPGNRYIFERARGEYVIPIDSDDIVYSDALKIIDHFIKENPNSSLLYSDEHQVDAGGAPIIPYFRRSPFSKVYAYSTCPFSHLTIFNREIGEKAGVYSNDYAQGSHDWDTALRIMEVDSNFIHIPYVLYGWRVHEGSSSSDHGQKSYTLTSQEKNLQNSLMRLGLSDRFLIESKHTGYYHLKRLPKNGPQVELNIVLHSQDQADNVVRNLKLTRYDNLEIRVHTGADIDAKSVSKEILESLKTKPLSMHSIASDGSISLGNSAPIIGVLDGSCTDVSPYWIWDGIGTLELDENIVLVGGQVSFPDQASSIYGLYREEDEFQRTPRFGSGSLENLVPDYEFTRNRVDAVYTGHCLFQKDLVRKYNLKSIFDSDSLEIGKSWATQFKSSDQVAFSPGISCKRNQLLHI